MDTEGGHRMRTAWEPDYFSLVSRRENAGGAQGTLVGTTTSGGGCKSAAARRKGARELMTREGGRVVLLMLAVDQ